MSVQTRNVQAMKNIGVGQSCQAADYQINRPKNRFTNILPYDHSRVKLVNVDKEEDGSDYINANYMPGFSSRKEFIAAQGPLPSTRDAFWQMAWEQQCPAIIALTKCVEKGRDKCHQYWPDQDRMSVTYGDIEVRIELLFNNTGSLGHNDVRDQVRRVHRETVASDTSW